ncbi:methionine ABC transporter ATP-binding protein [Saccharopolyspora indica]|uniref:D-methionine transport system ATP-binding protein n=2 Tax=Saccharopolyspora TaxID=1835 RepID=A0A1I5EU88_9PSEU|nr:MULTISPECIES: methionine ABC transporter ATP-binding protein [Saccharopolyspora]MDA3648032.1 methionine ABC transporter ATP-binding protein [Saccharopolyspora indica]RKT83545.1 D-methionine transport system ATP-binding protein [Saccharopolyspora antimicrobica]SEG79906.1 D-methionine transport system ATP-binding protein [Saccharopolyspora kobensis]SFD09838.1 D-methionine transport system ATP-binding protein [Saccharopolyspora kobensis]SFO14946.1 D-methionine transport system ATP-binding prot
MITVENLTKSFQHNNGTVRALDGVTMEVPAGAVCGVVGPSGAGKSTLARCIALLEKPDAGAIRVDGTDLVSLDGKALRAARRQIGVVPQGDSLLRQRTAAGNVALPLEAAGMSGPQRRSRVGELLDLVGLTDKASVYPDQLSGGQRQRIAVARALAAKPSVLLADEPTSALDPSTTDSVLTVLDRARAELGVTVLVVTHDMAVVRKIADDVAVLDGGRVVEHGKVLDLVAEPGSRVSSTLLPATDQAEPLRPTDGRHDVVAEVVLVGFAAVGALLPEAASRFGIDLAILGGGLTRLGDTPVAKFKVGLSGERAEAALKWMVERDAHVRRAPVCVDGVAA